MIFINIAIIFCIIMNRILQVDFFRGLLLILITTNHFLSKQDIIHHFTYEYIGWTTAAEGFVFLSGFTAGLVYFRKLVEKGEAFISLAAKKRAWTIYKYHLFLFLLVTLVLFSHPVMKEFWHGSTQEYKFLFQEPTLAVLLGSALVYQPIYLDILPMYALYMLLLPIVLKYFASGKQVLVSAVSFLLYLIGTLNLATQAVENIQFFNQVNTGFFNLISWQFLFVAGLYFGFLTYQNKISPILHNKKLFYFALIMCGLLFVFKQVHYKIDTSYLDLDYLASKENLGPLRLLNFFAWLLVMSYFASRYKAWFSFKPVCYLGKFSLEVFSFHILLIILFKPLKEYSNSFNAIRLTDSLYIYPWASFMLLFILLPALFLAPAIKKNFKNYTLKGKLAAHYTLRKYL